MRKDCAEAYTSGKLLKNQTFETEKGIYILSYIRYKNNVFMFKFLNGTMVEACNLSRMDLIKGG